MKHYGMLAAVLAAGLLGYALLGDSASAADEARGAAPTWEYHVLTHSDVTQEYEKLKDPDDAKRMAEAVRKTLDAAGAKGWELLSAGDGQYILKRERGRYR